MPSYGCQGLSLVGQGSLIVGIEAEEAKRIPEIGLKVLAGSFDAGMAGGVEQPDEGVAERGQPLRNREGAHPAAILLEDGIPDLVRAVLDAPVVAHVARDLPCGGAVW